MADKKVAITTDVQHLLHQRVSPTHSASSSSTNRGDRSASLAGPSHFNQNRSPSENVLESQAPLHREQSRNESEIRLPAMRFTHTLEADPMYEMIRRSHSETDLPSLRGQESRDLEEPVLSAEVPENIPESEMLRELFDLAIPITGEPSDTASAINTYLNRSETLTAHQLQRQYSTSRSPIAVAIHAPETEGEQIVVPIQAKGAAGQPPTRPPQASGSADPQPEARAGVLVRQSESGSIENNSSDREILSPRETLSLHEEVLPQLPSSSSEASYHESSFSEATSPSRGLEILSSEPSSPPSEEMPIEAVNAPSVNFAFNYNWRVRVSGNYTSSFGLQVKTSIDARSRQDGRIMLVYDTRATTRPRMTEGVGMSVRAEISRGSCSFQYEEGQISLAEREMCYYQRVVLSMPVLKGHIKDILRASTDVGLPNLSVQSSVLHVEEKGLSKGLSFGIGIEPHSGNLGGQPIRASFHLYDTEYIALPQPLANYIGNKIVIGNKRVNFQKAASVFNGYSLTGKRQKVEEQYYQGIQQNDPIPQYTVKPLADRVVAVIFGSLFLFLSLRSFINSRSRRLNLEREMKAALRKNRRNQQFRH
jgi:hypothetical protein